MAVGVKRAVVLFDELVKPTAVATARSAAARCGSSRPAASASGTCRARPSSSTPASGCSRSRPSSSRCCSTRISSGRRRRAWPATTRARRSSAARIDDAAGARRDGPEDRAAAVEAAASSEQLTVAVTYRKLLEVTHFHLFTVPVFLLIIAHLFMLTGLSSTAKTVWIADGLAVVARCTWRRRGSSATAGRRGASRIRCRARRWAWRSG